MWILKVVGAVLVICSATLIGYYFSNQLKQRVDDLKELKKNILILKGDIRYGNTPLIEAMEIISTKSSVEFRQFFKYVADELLKMNGAIFKEVWKQGVKEKLVNTALTKQDKEQLEQLGENLGYLDKDMQLNTIDFYIERLENEMEQANNAMKDKVRLYNTLGIMGGIFITIIIL